MKYGRGNDGILTAIKLMEAVIESKKTLAALAEPVKMLPQVTVNVRVDNKAAVRKNKEVHEAVETVSKRLGESGRILLRESGTEPVIRIMVEAESEALCREYCHLVADVIRREGFAE